MSGNGVKTGPFRLKSQLIIITLYYKFKKTSNYELFKYSFNRPQ